MASGAFVAAVHGAACRLVFLGLAAALVAGCASGPTAYSITGAADPVVNRDANGNSLSIVVYTYQLNGKNEFVRLTFDTVASGKSDGELFGQTLLGRTELVLVPGTRQVVTDKLLPETRYVGVVGLFRKPDAQRWRLLVDADAVRRKGLSLAVEDCYLKLLEPEPLPMPGEPTSYVPQCGGTAVHSGAAR